MCIHFLGLGVLLLLVDVGVLEEAADRPPPLLLAIPPPPVLPAGIREE